VGISNQTKKPIVMYVKTKHYGAQGTSLLFFNKTESNIKLTYDPDSGELLSVEKI